MATQMVFQVWDTIPKSFYTEDYLGQVGIWINLVHGHHQVFELKVILQWLPLESLQVQFYEEKMPFSERRIAI